MKRVNQAGHLFDALAGAPDGLTREEISAELTVSRRAAEQIIRTLRLVLGTDDDLFVPCDRGDDGVYRYRLTSGRAIVDDESGWTATRMTDLESRFILFCAAADAAVSATDGRTVQGRKARIFQRYTRRLTEDLAELDGRFFVGKDPVGPTDRKDP